MSENDDNLGRILIVDDDAAVCWSLEQALNADGYQTFIAADGTIAQRLIRKQDPDLVLTDIRMPGISGLELLAQLKVDHPNLPVIVMTAHGTMETAIEAVQQGAFDYLPKPIALERLRSVVRNAMGERQLVAVSQQNELAADGSIIGSTPAMQEVYRRVAAAAASDVGVLITGPTGSGKELVARALHQFSGRRDAPFVAVNCGALPDNLVESELFGHEAGAFTDAKQAKMGRIEAADGGVLFLDEVGELPPTAQVKLLRFLEDQRIVRVGGEEEKQMNVRVIAATNRDILPKEPGSSNFREDLSYRLRVVTIELPPLIDRLDDLPLLVKFFLSRIAKQLDRRLSITEDAMAALRSYNWPGNVRELRHVIEEGAVLATGGVIGPEYLNLLLGEQKLTTASTLEQQLSVLCGTLFNQEPGAVHQRIMERVELAIIREAMARCNGNQLRSAELLGINRITLKKRLDSAAD